MKRQLIIGLLMMFLIASCAPATAVPTAVPPTVVPATHTPRPTVTSVPSPTITPTPTMVLTPRPEPGCYRSVAWRSFVVGQPAYWTLTKKFNAENWTALNIDKGDHLSVWFQVSSRDTVGLIQVFFYQKSSDTSFFIAEMAASASTTSASFEMDAEYEVAKGDFYYVSIKRQPGEPCTNAWNYLFDIRKK